MVPMNTIRCMASTECIAGVKLHTQHAWEALDDPDDV